MQDYWVSRMNDARHNAAATANADLRGVYLQLFEHYTAMAAMSVHLRTARPLDGVRAGAGARSASAV
jgi:hypothetical protein